MARRKAPPDEQVVLKVPITLPVGMYVLNEPVHNPESDGRRSHDWRCFKRWTPGVVFYVIDVLYAEKNTPCRGIYIRYGVMAKEIIPELHDKLVRVDHEKDVHTLLEYEEHCMLNGKDTLKGALQRMVDDKIISVRQLREYMETR